MKARDAERLAAEAVRLVMMVRDDDPQVVGQHLASLSATRLAQLTIALAAMVPDDKPLSELLAWCESKDQRGNVRQLMPHGTHAAFNRHKESGQEPCAECREGERTYQRERARRRRASA